jgi:asparagine synthetase B (glutamine-hydrolysing)
MCGIFGWIKPKIDSKTDLNLRDSLIKGLIQTQTRGTDATGLYTTNHGVIKAATKASDFVKDNIPTNLSNCRFVIGHCRAASVGDAKKDKNAHPFESKSWILVHNGHADVKLVPGYIYTSECDSELLLAQIEINGITKVLKSFSGTAAIVLFNKKTNKLYFWTDSTKPFALAYYHGIIFFASTKSIIRNTLKIKHDLNIFPKISFATIYEFELLEFDMAKGTFLRKAEIEPRPKYIDDFKEIMSTDSVPSFDFVPAEPIRNIITKNATYANYKRPPLKKGCWVSNGPRPFLENGVKNE